jgi:hypothetical protein
LDSRLIISQPCRVPASRNGPSGVYRQALSPAVGTDSLPHLVTMDRNLGIDLEAQSHFHPGDPEDRDLKQATEAIGPSDHDRLPALSRQD